MRLLLAVALIFFTHLAYADDFSDRVAAGRAASQTPVGSEFDQSLIPLLGKAGDDCDPPGTKLPAAELGVVFLVGDITPAGKLINVETQPQNPLMACFAAQLERHLFDPPPRPGNYPILVQLTITP